MKSPIVLILCCKDESSSLEAGRVSPSFLCCVVCRVTRNSAPVRWTYTLCVLYLVLHLDSGHIPWLYCPWSFTEVSICRRNCETTVVHVAQNTTIQCSRFFLIFHSFCTAPAGDPAWPPSPRLPQRPHPLLLLQGGGGRPPVLPHLWTECKTSLLIIPLPESTDVIITGSYIQVFFFTCSFTCSCTCFFRTSATPCHWQSPCWPRM